MLAMVTWSGKKIRCPLVGVWVRVPSRLPIWPSGGIGRRNGLRLKARQRGSLRREEHLMGNH